MKPDTWAIAAEIVALRTLSAKPLTNTIARALAEAYAAGVEDGKRETADLLAAYRELIAEFMVAAEKVLAGLNARIDDAPDSAKPLYYGIAELHDALAKAKGTP